MDILHGRRTLQTARSAAKYATSLGHATLAQSVEQLIRNQ